MSIYTALASGAATIIGANIAAKGNKKAASIAANSERRSAEEIAAANRLAQSRLTEAAKLPTRLTPSRSIPISSAIRATVSASSFPL